MLRKDFWYDLPERLIAQTPLSRRDASRLLVLGRNSGAVEHRVFTDLTDYLKSGDCLVLNNTRVMPARLYGVKAGTGAKMEFVLLRRLEGDEWEVLLRPGRKAQPGVRVIFGDGLMEAEILAILDEGNRRVRFTYQGVFEQVLDKIGIMPLPPYITATLEDKERYQTVYSKINGSAAAPTAGLHFTPELLARLRGMGVDIAEVTLHVGLGTFRPVKAEKLEEHHMHTEVYQITAEACDRINAAKARGGRVIPVGTTSMRVLESVASETGFMAPAEGETAIFIYPGYRFKVADGLVTNFHLPESTLLMLISALAGRERILEAYQQAIDAEYRFFSFGDAMLIL